MKHIIKIDYKRLFSEEKSLNWYENVIYLLEANLDLKNRNPDNQLEANILFLTILKQINNQILNSTRTVDLINLCDLILK